MLRSWFNNTVDIRRRDPDSPRNALNEPDYGNELEWTLVYADIDARIENEMLDLQFNETGERNSNGKTYLYLNDDTIPKEEDRVIVKTADDAPMVNQLYIILSIYTEWGAVGNVHMYVCEINIH